MRTFYYISTGPARQEPRKSSPVQKEHNLFFLFQTVVNLSPQGITYNRTISIFQLVSHIYDRYLCHLLLFCPFCQAQQSVCALFAPCKSLQRRGRGSKHNTCPLDPCPLDGGLSGMIPRNLLTFVSRLVLLIHNNQPQMLKWCKQRRSGTDHHIDFPGSRPHHLVIALPNTCTNRITVW